MKKLLMSCVLCFAFGCSALTSNVPADWDLMSSSVSNFTELSARVVFASDKVKPYQSVVCNVVAEISPILQSYNDPNATLENCEQLILNAVKNSKNLNDQNRPIVSLVVKQLLDVANVYAKESYSALIQKDNVKSVLTVSKAVATGLSNACSTQNNMASLKVNRIR